MSVRIKFMTDTPVLLSYNQNWAPTIKKLATTDTDSQQPHRQRHPTINSHYSTTETQQPKAATADRYT